jgi:predicted nucleic acid-binding protein
VKLYLVEPDSAQFESLALISPAVTGMIARHEMRTVFHRREAEGAIPAGAAASLYRRMTSDAASGVLRLQPDSDGVEREFGAVLETCFSQTPPVFIRTNDALHLASARMAGETEFVTADVRQQAAAQLLGFKLLP